LDIKVQIKVKEFKHIYAAPKYPRDCYFGCKSKCIILISLSTIKSCVDPTDLKSFPYVNGWQLRTQNLSLNLDAGVNGKISV
jgi:hypothetical protein